MPLPTPLVGVCPDSIFYFYLFLNLYFVLLTHSIFKSLFYLPIFTIYPFL